jgi:uncharacterized protein YggE
MGTGQRLSAVIIVVLSIMLLLAVVMLFVQIPRATAATTRGEPRMVMSQETPPTISVRANAIVKVQPDTAYFEVGILTQDEDSAGKAQDVADRVIAKIMKALEEKGVARRDLATSVCNVRPSYAYPPDRRSIIGYHADNFVTVNVRDLSRLGETIDACMAAGATNISDVEFRVDDIRQYRKQGREMAVKNARERAEQLAAATGVKIVRVRTISETTSDYPRYGYSWWMGRRQRRDHVMSQAVAYASAEDVSGEPEIALGTSPIIAAVSVSFEVE